MAVVATRPPPVPNAARTIVQGLRVYASSWFAFTAGFLLLAVPFALGYATASWFGSAQAQGFVSRYVPYAAMPVNLLGDIPVATFVVPIVLGYVVASIAEAIVLIILSEIYHAPPALPVRCLRASRTCIKPTILVSVFQVVPTLLIVVVSGFLTTFAVYEALQNDALLPVAGYVLAACFIMGATWIATAWVSIVNALAVTQVILERRTVTSAIRRAIGISLRRAHLLRSVRQALGLSLFSTALFVVTLGAIVFVVLTLGTAAPFMAGFLVFGATVVWPTLFFPPVIVVYTLFAIALLCEDERAAHAGAG